MYQLLLEGLGVQADTTKPLPCNLQSKDPSSFPSQKHKVHSSLIR